MSQRWRATGASSQQQQQQDFISNSNNNNNNNPFRNQRFSNQFSNTGQEEFSPQKIRHQFIEDQEDQQYQNELLNLMQSSGGNNMGGSSNFSPNMYAMGNSQEAQPFNMYSQIQDDTGLNFALNRSLEDSQFQPPVDNFGQQADYQAFDASIIDQKIMQNIQKYISSFMAPQSQPQPQPQSIYNQNNFQIPNKQAASPDQQYQQMVQDFQKQSLNNSMRQNETQQNQIPLGISQQLSATQVAQNQLQSNSKTFQGPQFLQQQQQLQQVQNDHQISSEEFVMLKQVIQGLNHKIDSMQKLTENLQLTIDQKDREIQKIRSIYSMRGQKSEISQAHKQKVKREKGIQTVINLVDNRQEYETFSYLYDKDQDLIRSEKESLLKYLRKEVIQNQEFIDRINELEQENQQLNDEIAMYQNQLTKTNMIIQENMENQQQAEEERKMNLQDSSINCDILNEQEFLNLKQQIQQLEDQLFQEKNTVKELEETLNLKQYHLETAQDSTNNRLYHENTHLKSQLQQKIYDVDELKEQVTNLDKDKTSLTFECENLNNALIEKEKYYQDQIQKIKHQNLMQLDKVNQEKDRQSKMLTEREKQIWDLQAKINEQQKLILELEQQMDKKKKNKKKGECMECFKKEAEIQTLTAKLLKIQNESSVQIQDFEKQVRQKQSQINDGQSLIQTLTLQLQENIQKGGDDPNVKKHIEKIQKDNDEKSKMIEQLKTNMEKQAAQFMMQLIQQQK